MPRYFFNLHECGTATLDEEGTVLDGVDVARARALRQARAIMSAEVEEGRLCLSCNIEVLDERREPVLNVPFREALSLTGV